jgi:Mn2+/Fe2+ NRAMP family transporter
VPVMVVMMIITANPEIMGKFPVSGVLKTVGWAATFIMAAAAIVWRPAVNIPSRYTSA